MRCVNIPPLMLTDGWVILLFSLLAGTNYLLFNAYPLFSPEAALFILCLVTLLVPFWAVFRKMGRAWVFHGFLAALFLDLSIGFADPLTFLPRFPIPFVQAFLQKFGAGLPASWGPAVTLSLTYSIFTLPLLILAGLWQKRISRILLVGFFAMFITTGVKFLLLPEPLIRTDRNENQASRAPSKPPVVVLILDEHVGIEGIPLIHEEAKALKETLIADYVRNGFKLYGRAYTNYFQTHYSIPSLLNHFIWRDGMTHPPASNRLLEKFHEEGYALNLYQSTYVEFCKPLKSIYQQCYQYKHNSIGFLKSARLPFPGKAIVMLSAFMEAHQSVALEKIFWFLSSRWKIIPWGHVEPLPAFEVLERIKADLAREKGGTVFFAHLLIPHSPYVFDRECQIKPVRKWDQRHIEGNGNPDAIRRGKQANYLEQAACTHKKLKEFFEAMAREGVWENATVLIFGDHGSRIYARMLYEEQKGRLLDLNEATARDLVELFSNFLAVKKPGWAAGYVLEKTPTAGVLLDLVNFTPLEETPPEKFLKIYLASQDQRARKYYPYEMIDF